MQEHGGDRVGHGGALHPEDAVAVPLFAAYLQLRLELRWVRHRDLQEQDRVVGGIWWRWRSSCSFSRYSRMSRACGSLAMMRISPLPAASSRKRRAVSSSSTLVTRSSVARVTREISEVARIAAIKNEAILTPSGRSMTFAIVV